MAKSKATHKSKKTGNKVFVERFEGNIIVVKSVKGKVLGSYNKSQMAKFNEKYESLRTVKGV